MKMITNTLKGVNLGGWLVLERWMTPSVFAGSDAMDEKTLSEQHQARITEHHKTFIDEEDFAWIAKHGLKAIRIPVGCWIFGDEPPFVGSIDRLDFAFDMAKKYKLQVVISLHGAPGSQNGYDHSGQVGKAKWHWDRSAKAKTLAVIEALAKRYGQNSQLWGMEVLNEPASGLLRNFVLRKYYKNAYKIIRSRCAEETKIIISDSFRPEKWLRFMKSPDYKNIVMDTHLYQCFSPADKRLNIEQHLEKARQQQARIACWQNYKPVIIGEWSLGLSQYAFDSYDKPKQRQLLRQYASEQIKSYDTALAWFFWSYKMEHNNNWNFQHLVESSVIKLFRH